MAEQDKPPEAPVAEPTEIPSVQGPTPRESAIARAQAELDAFPKHDEFVQPPGAIDESIAKTQGQCVAGEYGIKPENIQVRQWPGETQILVDGTGGTDLRIKQEVDSGGVSIPKCDCGPEEIWGLKRSTFSIDKSDANSNTYAGLSTYTKTNGKGGEKSLLSQMGMPDPKSKFGTNLSQKSRPVTDGSLANGPSTLMSQGNPMQTDTMEQDGDNSRSIRREATPAEQQKGQSALDKAIKAGVKCGIINYGGG